MTAITDLLARAEAAEKQFYTYKDVIDRMGSFGRLFVPYKGDPRGPIGRAGSSTLEEEAVIMSVLTHVDGGKWRPVKEDVLRDLFSHIYAAKRDMAEYKARAEKAESIASDLCDDFTDFVTGGVPNPSPYCANRRPECVDVRGWCKGDSKVCKGFLPRAAIEKEE